MQTYDRRFEDVLDNAESLFAEKGFHATTMRDIAHAAGMSVAGLYYYLPSKETGLYLVCTRTFDRLDAATQALQSITGPRQQLHALVRAHLRYMLENDAAYRVLLRDMDALHGEYRDRLRMRKRRYFSFVSDLVGALPRSSDTVSPRVAAGALFGMLNWTPSWYRHDLDGDTDTIADNMLALFLHGIALPAAIAEVPS